METRVVNVRRHKYDVYIGRKNSAIEEEETPVANPFPMSKGFSREESIRRYRKWFYDKIESDKAFKAYVLGLRGKKLGCWCKPMACHGDVIVEYIENYDDEFLEDVRGLIEENKDIELTLSKL